MLSHLTRLQSAALAIALSFVFGCPPAHSDQLQEVRSLTVLPKGVRDALSVSKQGEEGIADVGEPFNVTDVVRESLPFRRLILAGISDNRVIVGIEHGGIGYSIEVLTFSLVEDNWIQTGKVTHLRRDKPTTVAELVQWAESPRMRPNTSLERTRGR